MARSLLVPAGALQHLARRFFDFRGYGENSPNGWEDVQDAQAAFETAATLDKINPQRMAEIGAGIGTGGASDGCLLYNQACGGGCLGAMSLSPGSHLGLSFAKTIYNPA